MTPLLLALTFAAPVPKDFKKAVTDLQAIQGEWEEVERSNNGNPVVKPTVRYIVEGNTVKILSGSAVPRVVKWTLNETDKTYLWEAPWGTWTGRYKLDGDRLIRMSARKGVALPDVIAPGKTVEYSVHRRVKK